MDKRCASLLCDFAAEDLFQGLRIKGLDHRFGQSYGWSAKAQREARSFCSAHPCASPLRGLRVNLLLADLCSVQKRRF